MQRITIAVIKLPSSLRQPAGCILKSVFGCFYFGLLHQFTQLLSCPVLNLFSFNIGTETGGEDAIKTNLQYLNADWSLNPPCHISNAKEELLVQTALTAIFLGNQA